MVILMKTATLHAYAHIHTQMSKIFLFFLYLTTISKKFIKMNKSNQVNNIN